MKNTVVFTKEETLIGQLTALVTLPAGHDPAKEKLPVIVFLHGAGESGRSTPETVEKVRVHGVPKLFCADADYKGLRVITVSPQCTDGLVWDQITLQLMDLIRSAVEKFGGDEARVSLTGLSMGGFGTWNLLTTYPGYFWRAASVCGGGVSWRVNETLRGKPIRMYHSVDDDSVPYEYSVLLARRARECGAEVELISYTDEGHGCWNRAYEHTDLTEWLAGAI